MGGKRVGLARTERLVENLRRELALGGASLTGNKQVVMSKSAAYTLAAEDSGKLIQQAGSAFTLTLPAVSTSAGIVYDIVATAANDYVISENAADSNVLSMVSVNASNTERDHAFTTATLSSGAIGDKCHIICDGTFWYITYTANAAVNAA